MVDTPTKKELMETRRLKENIQILAIVLGISATAIQGLRFYLDQKESRMMNEINTMR